MQMLNFSVSQDRSSLLLNDLSLHPLYALREKSLFIGRASDSPPKFSAWQVETNISAYELDLIYPSGYRMGTSMGGFMFAYEHMLFPARDPNDVLILFNLIGLMDGYMIPRTEFEFSATNRTKETLQIVLTGDETTNNLNITSLELVPKANTNDSGYVFGEGFNGRLDLLDSDPNITTFIPKEWDECGRKDNAYRQRLCKLAGWWDGDSTLFGIIFGSIVGAIPVLAGLFYLVWLLRQGQEMSTGYLENIQRSEEEYARLIDTSDVQNEAQHHTQDKSQSLPGADMVVVFSGKSVPEEADLKGSITPEPEPQTSLETNGAHGRRTPNNDDLIFHGSEECSQGEDNQNHEFGPFLHNFRKTRIEISRPWKRFQRFWA